MNRLRDGIPYTAPASATLRGRVWIAAVVASAAFWLLLVCWAVS